MRYFHCCQLQESKRPFTLQKNRVRTCPKSSTDRIILGVYSFTRMMFYHGSDKKRHKDQVRKVAFTLQFLGDRTNFLHGTTVFATAVCCYRTYVILVNKMATRDAELSVLVRSLSKRKSTGSMLTLMELNKRISLQERVYRKRKLNSMVIFLIFLLSQCTVERPVWQRNQAMLGSSLHMKHSLTMNCLKTSVYVETNNVLVPRATRFFYCACH